MRRRMMFGFLAALLVVSMLSAAFSIRSVEAEYIFVYIRADGSIDPPDAPISTADNTTYTLFGNVNGSILIERSGIVINGNSCMIKGFVLTNIDNVTIENTVVLGGNGVSLKSSSHVVLSENVIAQNDVGIAIRYSSNNNISGNIVALNRGYNIALDNSLGNVISGNYIGGMETPQGLAVCDYGIEATSSSNNTIIRNNVTLCTRAIRFEGYSLLGEDASNNNITENNIQHLEWGILIAGSSNNTITRNNVTSLGGRLMKQSWGISLIDHSFFNTIAENRIALSEEGLTLSESHFNFIIQNNVTGNIYGLKISSSAWNLIDQNHIANNYFGILIGQNYPEYNNTLRYNDMFENTYNFGVEGSFPDALDVDTTNTVDGKPIYYWVNKRDAQIPSDAGYVAIVNSTNIRAEGLDLRNNYQGILIANSNGITILHNNVTNNRYGIRLESSLNNTISENDVTDNSYDGISFVSSRDNYVYRNRIMSPYATGISLEWSSNNSLSQNTISNNTTGISLIYSSDNNGISGNTLTLNYGNVWFVDSSHNTIYHNNFCNSTRQVGFWPDSQENIWDNGYPSGGNYWSDYAGADLYGGPHQNESGSDGIGDTPFAINGDNADNYPLMKPWLTETMICDINHDGTVNILDIVAIASIYGSKEGEDRWNPDADVASPYGRIDILDLVTCAGHYGEKYP